MADLAALQASAAALAAAATQLKADLMTYNPGVGVTPVTTIAASGASLVLTAPANGDIAYMVTLTGNCVLSLAGGTAGQQQTVTVYLHQDSTAGRVPVLPSNVSYAGAIPTPNSIAGNADVFRFTSPDGGSTWINTLHETVTVALTAPTPPTGGGGTTPSSVAVPFSGFALPLTYSLDQRAFAPLPTQPAAGATSVDVPVPGNLLVGQHFITLKDANGVLSGGTTGPAKFTVAPVANGSYAAPGVPRLIGFYQDSLDSAFASKYQTQVANININPGAVLIFPGTFGHYEDAEYRFAQEAASWSNNPLLNGSNGTLKAIPVLGYNLWFTDGQFTFKSILTGVYDQKMRDGVTAWHTAGFTEIWDRMGGWEVDYPTTPSGQGAQKGAYPNGSTANSADPLYPAAYIAAFRYAAKIRRAQAVSLGMTYKTIWEPSSINYCDLDPKTMFPDNDLSDGAGKQVDINGNDKYHNNFYSSRCTEMHDGYDLLPPMTPQASQGNQPDLVAWAQNAGNLAYFDDFQDSNTTNPDGWGGGWSEFESIRFAAVCPMGPNPIFHPEMGGVTTLDGGHNGGLTVTQPDGPLGSHDDGGPFFSGHFARNRRRTWAYAQSLGVQALGGCFWFYQSNGFLQSVREAFPELTIGYTGSKVSQLGTPPAKTVVAPLAPALTVTAGPNENILAILSGSVSFAPITQYDLYSSTNGGAMSHQGVIVPVGGVYLDPCPAGTAKAYHVTCSNSAGASPASATAGATAFTMPVGSGSRLNNVVGGRFKTPLTAAMVPTGVSFIEIDATVQPSALNASDQYIGGVWGTGATADTAYLLYIHNDGTLNIVAYCPGYVGTGSSVPLPNYCTQGPFRLSALIDIETGVADYAISPDRGTTWNALGTSVSSSGSPFTLNIPPLAGNFLTIGGAGAQAGGDFIGAIYDVTFKINGTTVADLNFAGVAAGATSITDAQGHVWTAAGGASVSGGGAVSESLTVAAPSGTVTAGGPYSTTGTYVATSAPTALDVSGDNGSTWVPVSNLTSGSGTYSFSSVAGGAGQAAIKVRDHNNQSVMSALSPYFTVSAASGGSGTVPTVVQVASVMGTSAAARTLTLPAPATAGNSVILIGNGLSSAASIVPTSPTGFTRDVDYKTTDGQSICGIAFSAPVSALSASGVSFTNNDTFTIGTFYLVEISGATTFTASQLVTTVGGVNATAQIPAQGAATPLRLGLAMQFLNASTTSPFTATSGTVLNQNNGNGNNVGSYGAVLFTQASAAAIQLTQSGGVNVNSLQGVGLEVS